MTVADLGNDLKEWRIHNYITKAELIKHVQLRDTVMACREAHKWFNVRYDPIKLSKKCSQK